MWQNLGVAFSEVEKAVFELELVWTIHLAAVSQSFLSSINTKIVGNIWKMARTNRALEDRYTLPF